ncbi:MAG: heavy metal-responsive transcriptional regulator [Gammaproteobacteria bacterium]
MTNLTIGKLAQRAEVSKVTIRYYERCGLIPEAQRSDAGYRLYSEAVLTPLHFISNAKAAGFSLSEISELLALKKDSHATSRDVKNRVLAKAQMVKEKIALLQALERDLQKLADSCDGKVDLDECPILGSFYNE